MYGTFNLQAKAMTLFTYPQARKFVKVRLGFIQNNRSNAERSEEASAGYLIFWEKIPIKLRKLSQTRTRWKSEWFCGLFCGLLQEGWSECSVRNTSAGSVLGLDLYILKVLDFGYFPLVIHGY